MHTIDPTKPLLTQARERLAAALTAERAARRDVELAGSGVTWDHVAQAQQETRRAQEWLDQVERSCAALPTAEEEARRTLLIEESQLLSLRDTNRRAEAQQARRVEQARAQVARLEADRRTLQGEADAYTA
jgi:hypothetical protein